MTMDDFAVAGSPPLFNHSALYKQITVMTVMSLILVGKGWSLWVKGTGIGIKESGNQRVVYFLSQLTERSLNLKK